MQFTMRKTKIITAGRLIILKDLLLIVSSFLFSDDGSISERADRQ